MRAPPSESVAELCAAIATMAALEEPSILVNSPLKRLGAAVVNGVYVDTTAVAAAIRGAASTAAGGAWSYLRRLQMPVWANGEASLAPAQQEGHGREGGGQWGPCAEPESADGAALNPHGELCGGRRNW